MRLGHVEAGVQIRKKTVGVAVFRRFKTVILHLTRQSIPADRSFPSLPSQHGTNAIRLPGLLGLLLGSIRRVMTEPLRR